MGTIARFCLSLVRQLVARPEDAAGEHVEVGGVLHRLVAVRERRAEDALLPYMFVQMTAWSFVVQRIGLARGVAVGHTFSIAYSSSRPVKFV